MLANKFEAVPALSKDSEVPMFYEIRPLGHFQHFATFHPNPYIGITIDDAKLLAERFCELINAFGIKD